MGNAVVVKHQGKSYEVEIEEGMTGEDFKSLLYSLTDVEPDRQKVLIKGGQLKNDADMAKLGLKNGQTIMMIGNASSSADAALAKPKAPVKFLEDMTEAEAAKQEGATPAGLQNLGNTCYLNSTLQTLRSIPELQESLAKYTFKPQVPAFGRNTSSALDLTSNLRDLYKQMSETQSGFAPIAFLTALRTAYPQFAERSKTGHGYAQQDAEEAWSEIINSVRQNLVLKEGRPGEPEGGVSWVDRYMAGEFVSTTECDDPEAKEAGEQPTTSKEKFVKLNCHIDSSINHLRDGIVAGLKEKLEKTSPTLGREAAYTKTSKISRLPKYLTVHFVRFFWKRESQKKAKIMRKVTFPAELDVVEFCTPELKAMLIPVRDKVREIRKEEEDIERARKRRKQNHQDDVSTASRAAEKKKEEAPPASTSGGDVPMADDGTVYKTDADVEAERAASLLAAKKELYALINPELAADDGANQSGLYELRAVVTHQGASADSGHYTAYVKKAAPVDPATGKKTGPEDGRWWWFNDDKVSEVPAEKIEMLSGGGESHSALILLYRAIPLPDKEGITH